MVLNKETNKLINEYVNNINKIETFKDIDKLTKTFLENNIHHLKKDRNFLMDLYKLIYLKLQNKYLKLVDKKIKLALKNNINLG